LTTRRTIGDMRGVLTAATIWIDLIVALVAG
jgi:hypothetical protein